MGKLPKDKTITTVYIPKKLKDLVKKHSLDKSLSAFIVKAMQKRVIEKGWATRKQFQTGEEV